MVAPPVGLGIVTSKKVGGFRRPLPAMAAAVMQRFQQTPLRSAMAVWEVSEYYTCVFSSVGENGPASKMVSFYDGDGGVIFELPPPPMELPLPPADFLSCCYLCRKKLHGLDIFMYRGEEAFCSVECRYQQILSDEQKEQDSKALNPPKFYLFPLFSASYAAALW